MTEPSLYERLGGAFAIAAVGDQFSDALISNQIVGQSSENPALREWHTNNLARLPGLKFMRTLWVCDISGGPQGYAATEPGRTTRGVTFSGAMASKPDSVAAMVCAKVRSVIRVRAAGAIALTWTP